jgi:hypothetical protein
MVKRAGCSSAIESLRPALLPSRERRTGDPPAKPRETDGAGQTSNLVSPGILSVASFSFAGSLLRNPHYFLNIVNYVTDYRLFSPNY